ncbi:histidine phosphatase family protein [Mycolicibacterium neoaurum]|uniref:histidine phosphatase family protein n=1 Tax=Mycolicibacterium neoaurum TaxID=1795 RepID=UPI0026731937|nr:histidine phosphatase family protein [Mycolicibacterium neoaurum]MDO3402733.1 histidine phosphatase family protein [Mycolicibacterium neoaurum]
MHLILMRHGEPVRSGPDALDPELSPTGLTQAAAAVPYLRLCDVAALYSSPQRRAAQTASVVADVLGRPVEVDQDLVEFDHGAPYVHYDDGSAPVWRSYLAGDLSPWGLTAAGFQARVTGVMDRLARTHPAEATVLAVCHGGVINAWTCQVLGARERLFMFEPGYCALNRYECDGGSWKVVSLNECPPAETSSTNK